MAEGKWRMEGVENEVERGGNKERKLQDKRENRAVLDYIMAEKGVKGRKE